MDAETRFRFKFFKTSLRIKVAVGLALPVLLILISLSLLHYWRGRQLLEDQMRLTALQLSEMVMGSLRHAMLTNNPELLAQSLANMGRPENMQQVQIIGLNGQVKADNIREQVGLFRRLDEPGCTECHQFLAESRPRTMRLATSSGGLRISAPIPNEPDCAGCHPQKDAYLGDLLVDISVASIEDRLNYDLQLDLAISLGITLLVTLGVYLMIQWLVVRRVEAFHRPLAQFAAQDFTVHLPPSPLPTDELGELANAFNAMADELECRTREQEERSKLRQRVITEERGRIARELHDGLAQLLGYVNTKAMAVRLMVKNRQMEAADKTLLQLEEAARDLFVDVRGAILDLKMAEPGEADLTTVLKDFTTHFSRLSNLPVELNLAPTVATLALPPETQQQLLRIVQESLTNIRKHALATRACVSMQIDGKILELTISDDGRGFDPAALEINDRQHFGVSTMSERAEEIGAEFQVDSKPGAGTCVTVRLPLKKLAQTQED